MENDKNKKFNYTAALARKEVSLCKELYKMAKERHPQPGLVCPKLFSCKRLSLVVN
jgi:hypothetical protein